MFTVKRTDFIYNGLIYHKGKAMGEWLTTFTVCKDLQALQKVCQIKQEIKLSVCG